MYRRDLNQFFKNTARQGLVGRKGLCLCYDMLKQEQKNEKEKRNDFLQLLVEAKTGQIEVENESELNQFEKDAQLNSNSKSKLQITETMAIAQGLLFFIAG